VDALVDAGRLRTVPADAARASDFVSQADDRLSQLPLLSSHAVKSGIAYDAAHDIGEAFLAWYGLGTMNGPGQHAAIGDFLVAILDAPPAVAAAAAMFDQARRTRNQQNYRANPVGAAQADAVERMAVALRDAAESRGIGVG
jgi:hypothetical protein